MQTACCPQTGIQRTGCSALVIPDACTATSRLSHLTSSTLNAARVDELPLALAVHERLEVTGAVAVGPADSAVARRAARHRSGEGSPARVQRARPGHLDRRAPGVVRLADHERLPVTMAVQVGPAGRAVARGTRHRVDPAYPALVQRRQVGHLDRRAPGGAG